MKMFPNVKFLELSDGYGESSTDPVGFESSAMAKPKKGTDMLFEELARSHSAYEIHATRMEKVNHRPCRGEVVDAHEAYWPRLKTISLHRICIRKRILYKLAQILLRRSPSSYYSVSGSGEHTEKVDLLARSSRQLAHCRISMKDCSVLWNPKKVPMLLPDGIWAYPQTFVECISDVLRQELQVTDDEVRRFARTALTVWRTVQCRRKDREGIDELLSAAQAW